VVFAPRLSQAAPNRQADLRPRRKIEERDGVGDHDSVTRVVSKNMSEYNKLSPSVQNVACRQCGLEGVRVTAWAGRRTSQAEGNMR